ncbi:MAG TPA: nitroreductase family protein [Trueperaceae bacterium]|nr:nitroreductase family protein [Trueperaceae bacterium]
MQKTVYMPLDFKKLPEPDMIKASQGFYEQIKKRRTVRDFSSKMPPKEVIENALLAAGTAPSGANLQPWHFVVVSNSAVKQKIRDAAEEEEKEFYSGRAPQEWIEDLSHLGTGWQKPHLTDAPYLIAIFAQSYGLNPDGSKKKHYYVQESVGIATGFLIAALHNAGLATLTHTPSPMNFLNDILDRPKNERAFLLLVVGYPKDDVSVPTITKKSLGEIAEFV